MGVSRFLYHFLFGFFASLILAIPSPAQDPKSELASVFAAWERRKTDVRTVRYVVHGKKVFPKGCYSQEPGLPADVKGDVPKEDYIAKTSLWWLVDFQNNRFLRGDRTESFQVDRATFIPNYIVKVFDGSEFRAFAPREENTSSLYEPSEYQPEIYLGTSGSTHHFFDAYEWPLLMAHGIITQELPDVRRWNTPPDRDRFRIHGRAVAAGRPCLVVRTQPRQDRRGQFEELWVDVPRDAAVLRWQRYRSGRVILTFDITYQEIANQWLPKEWRSVSYDHESHVGSSFALQVTEIDVNLRVDPNDFQPKFEPGRVVLDNKDERFYRVESGGKLVPIRLDSHKPDSSWRTVLAFFLIALVIGMAILLARRMRRLTGE